MSTKEVDGIDIEQGSEAEARANLFWLVERRSPVAVHLIKTTRTMLKLQLIDCVRKGHNKQESKRSHD